MRGEPNTAFARNWREIVVVFLRLGATAYGGPAIMRLIQAEVQERRQWVSKEQFLEGLTIVNVVPGATETQLRIFPRLARGGWRGSALAGICFMAPAFCIMLVLAATYSVVGATPVMRAALYGLGPFVLASFVVAIFRLARATVTSWIQLMLSCVAGGAVAFSPLGVGSVLAVAIGAGMFLFYSRRAGALAMAVFASSSL